MNTLNDAFEDLVKCLYSAEKQLLLALPKVAEMAQNPELKTAMKEHLSETREHVTRLEQIADTCEFSLAEGKVSKAMQGLIDGASEMVSPNQPGPALDALLICAAQQVETFEISSYETAINWAKALDLDDCEDLLKETLKEEKDVDSKLGSVARDVLNEAVKQVATVQQQTKGYMR